MRRFAERLSDAQLLSLLSAALFVLAAWPLLLVEVPPLQDLPNHLATITVLRHPELYPELRSNGFLKTNSALFVWLLAVGKVTGTRLAARLFVALVLAANAWILPRVVAALTGRDVAIVASLFAWPMVHNWFVSTGMLDFALALPMSIGVLLLLHTRRPALASGLAVATWYAHAFPLIVIHALVALHVVTRSTWSARIGAAKTHALPLAPATALVAASTLAQIGDGPGAMTGFVAHRAVLPTWELVYNLWAEWTYGFTWLSITSFVPAVLLAAVAIRNARVDRPLFSPIALAALAAGYALAPYIATNWFYVSTRLIPFLSLAALVRVPAALPPKVAALLVACALLYSVGMGIDYVRLDGDRAALTAGIGAVPEGARLLPLLFRHKRTSENTRNILHAWGYYVEEKHTAAPLLFAHSRSFPVMYASPPPPRLNHLVLENFAPSMRDPDWMCRTLREGGIALDDCDGAWRERWAEFWRTALPRYDHVMMWDPPDAVRALVPPEYHAVFERDRLVIYAR